MTASLPPRTHLPPRLLPVLYFGAAHVALVSSKTGAGMNEYLAFLESRRDAVQRVGHGFSRAGSDV